MTAHDRAHKVFRLRGLALDLERGRLDDIFTEERIDIAAIREAAARYIRQTANALDEGALL